MIVDEEQSFYYLACHNCGKVTRGEYKEAFCCMQCTRNTIAIPRKWPELEEHVTHPLPMGKVIKIKHPLHIRQKLIANQGEAGKRKRKTRGKSMYKTSWHLPVDKRIV